MNRKAHHGTWNAHRHHDLTLRLIIGVATLLGAAFVHAQTCSGGVGGGMDATGNQCNTPQGYFDRDSAWNTADSEALCEDGLREYHRGHYAQAVLKLRQAAGAGDPDAAELLALMYRFGERLYGDEVRANPVEAARWVNAATKLRSRAAATGQGAVRPED